MNISKQNIVPLHGTHRPKRETLPRTWFMARGYKLVDLDLMNGHPTYVHPHKNTALNQFGQQITLQLVPLERHMKTSARYLKFNRERRGKYLAHVKYLTFIGPIHKGDEIDHIDGNPLNNSINNLRAVPRAINRRDGGFLRKLRNHKIFVADYPGIILEGYERMAKYKATHTQVQYDRLTRTELLQIFLGAHETCSPRSRFTIDPRTTDDIMLFEMQHHMEL